MLVCFARWAISLALILYNLEEVNSHKSIEILRYYWEFHRYIKKKQAAFHYII